MHQDLTNKGCGQAKTFTLTFPTVQQVPSELIHHFMRGYFDGDGTIHIKFDKNKDQLQFKVIGTYEFLRGYENVFLNKLYKVIPKEDLPFATKEHNNIRTLAYGGNGICRKIYRFLYKDATVFLERKKSIFEEIIRPS